MLKVCLGVFEAGVESIVVTLSSRGAVLLCLDMDVDGKILVDEGGREPSRTLSGGGIEGIRILFGGSLLDMIYEVWSDEFPKNFTLALKKN